MLFRRVYPHLANWVPIPRVAAFPTFRHGLFCRFIDAAAALKNDVLLPIMALRGCHELDAAVAVLGKRCIYPIIPRQPDSWLNPGHGYSTATRPQFHRPFLPAAGVPARSAATRRVRDHWPLPSAATST